MEKSVVKANNVSISQLVNDEGFRARAEKMLGERTPQFLSSVLTLANADDNIKNLDPIALYNTCLMAASINLPFNSNLGQAYIVPYKGKPQLQIGWKGFVQLAQRSGMYKTINVTDVREGEIEEFDRLSGEIKFSWIQDDDERLSKKVIGYVSYFQLLNGFEKSFFMTRVEVESHAKKYSQTFKKGFGIWKDDFDSMAKKTVLKLLISKYGPQSIEMTKAIEIDQVIDGEYADNPKNAKSRIVVEAAEVDIDE